MSEDLVDEPSKLTVQCYFVRGRNALLVRAKMEPLFIDYYLHLMEQGIQPERDHDLMLKDALAAMALHTASRPQDETTAWTIHFEKPRINLFVTGSTHPGQASGPHREAKHGGLPRHGGAGDRRAFLQSE
jgi:molecular chaperone Hsp33